MTSPTFVLRESSTSAATKPAPTTPKTATGSSAGGNGGNLPPVLVLVPLSPEPERRKRKRPALADCMHTWGPDFSGYRLEEGKDR